MKNNLYLFYDNNNLSLYIEGNIEKVKNSSLFKLYLRRFIDRSIVETNKVVLKKELKYPDYKKVINILEHKLDLNEYDLFIDDNLRAYISKREYYINELSRIGLSIKKKDDLLLDRFNKFKEELGFLMTRKLRDKQVWDSFFMTTMKKAANFSVPGSGKTSSVLGVFAYLENKGLVNKLVMVGPKNSFTSWIDEFGYCFGDKLKLKVFCIQDYSNLESKRHSINYNTANKNLLLFNYESLNSVIKEMKFIIDEKTLLVFDEVHKVKAIGGVRAEDALNISENAFYKIVLTGTPIPNSYLDIKNMLHILYQDEYDDFFNFNDGQLKNPSTSDIEDINKKIQPFFCRTTKEELEVPVVNDDIIIDVEASDELNKIYQILKSKYRKNKLALIIRLMQVQTNPKLLLKSIDDIEEFREILDITGDIEDIDYKDYSDEIVNLIDSINITNKFNACVSWAKKIVLEGKTCIIWCVFIDSIIRLQKELTQEGFRVKIIYGAVDEIERKQVLQDFRNGEIDILITNPHTLAESVSLHSVCHDAIYYEYSYNLVHMLQSKDRIHRLGLELGQYTQYYFITNIFSDNELDYFSLDKKIYDRLKEKEEIMLNAIENDILEQGFATEDDIEFIFR